MTIWPTNPGSRAKLTTGQRKLGEVCDIIYGFAFKANEFNEAGKGLSVVRIGDVDKNKTDKFFDGKYDKRYLINRGDILLGLSGSFKASCWGGDKALMNQRVATLRNFESKTAESFIFYQLPRLLHNLEQLIAQLSVKNILTKHLNNLRVLYPPLKIQKQIVERLDAIKKAQELNDKQIALADELFQSLLHQELKSKIKNQKSKLQIKIKKLKDVVKVHYGKGLPKSERVEKGEYFAYGSNGPIYKTSKILVKYPTIIIGRKGAAGALYLVKEPSYPIDTTFYTEIKNQNELNLDFLYFLLQTLNLQHLAIITAVPGINRDSLYNLKIPLPPIETQRKIVEKLSAVQEYKKKLLEQKQKLQELFDSVLNKSFKGEL